jgi:hypothetical protein
MQQAGVTFSLIPGSGQPVATSHARTTLSTPRAARIRPSEDDATDRIGQGSAVTID